MISVSSKGDFKNTNQFLKSMNDRSYLQVLNKYGQEGVNALSSATPTNSGETANSWFYEVTMSKNGSAKITWSNSNVVNGAPVAILIQYGHATGNGGYVRGIDYINPALKPVFDKIANAVWREVTNS